MKNTVFYDLAESNKSYREWMQADDSVDYSNHIKKCLLVAIQEELTERQRDFFLKYHIDGWSIYAISDYYKVNISTVSRTLKAATNNIARVMRYSAPHLLTKYTVKKNRK